MKDLEYPRFMCRPGTAWELETGRYDVRTVATADEAEAAYVDGWRFDQYDHQKGEAAPATEPAPTPRRRKAAP